MEYLDKTQLFAYLKDNLSINIERYSRCGGDDCGIVVELLLKDEDGQDQIISQSEVSE